MCVCEREREGGRERNERGVQYISTCRIEHIHKSSECNLSPGVVLVETGNGTCSCLYEVHSVLTLAS